MKYKSCYCDLLIISAYFYFLCALMDFSITMKGYFHYGNSFFEMELNTAICFLLSNGIHPIHMFIIPLVVIMLCLYLEHIIAKIRKHERIQKTTIIRDRSIWGIWFATLLISSMAILHLLGFISWFYHGAF